MTGRAGGPGPVGRLLQPLLLLYPARFRRAYGYEMLRFADARCARARAERGRAAALVCAVQVAADFAWNGIQARLYGGPSDAAPAQRTGGHMTLHVRTQLRDAARSLRREPGFAATVVLTLAIGSGATLALFGIVDAALLRPLPYPQADRLFSIVQRDARFGLTPFAPPYLSDLRERLQGFDVVGGFSPAWTMTLTGRGEPRIVTGAYVSDRVFELLGVEAVRGRLFLQGEHVEGGGRVAVVSEGFWEGAFGAATPLEGQTIRLDGVPHTIVGIVPQGFRLPIKDSAVTQGRPSASLWLPFALNPYATLRMVPVMNVIGRLRTGVTPAAARAEIEAVGRTLARDFPEHAGTLEATAVTLDELVTAEARPVVWPLFGAAVFLLLIACANVANLLLARGATRRHEVAIRASLGATRRRIVGQFLTESLVLAAAGCALGLLLAQWMLGVVPSLGLEGLPPSADIRLEGRLVLFTAVLAGLTAVAFGLVPAVRASGDGSGALLKTGARVAAGGTRLRRGLVAAQAALAVALLAGGGLLARSFLQLTHVDPGFLADGVLAVPIDLGAVDPPRRGVFLDQLAERLRGLPGVTHVSAVNRSPLSGSNVLVGVEIEGNPVTAREPVPMDRRVVTPGYFQALQVPLIEGREFGSSDRSDGSLRVAIVNEAAGRLWADGRAVGGRLRLMLQSGPGPWLTVVGVSGNVLHERLDRAARPEVSVPYSQAAVGSMIVLVRTRGDAAALTAGAKAQVWALNPDLPLDGVRPLAHALTDAVSEPRFRMWLLNGFAALALLMAALGIYAVTAYTVTRRTRDIGVRMALGAKRSDVLRLVLGDGLRPVLWGGVAGLAASFWLTRAIGRLLFGVTPVDPLTYTAAVSVLLAAAFLAAYLPARRASRIEPVIALRVE